MKRTLNQSSTPDQQGTHRRQSPYGKTDLYLLIVLLCAISFTLGTFLDLAGLRVSAAVALSKIESFEKQLHNTHPHLNWGDLDDADKNEDQTPTDGLMLSSFEHKDLHVLRREHYRFKEDGAGPQTVFGGAVLTFGSTVTTPARQFAYAQPRVPSGKSQTQTNEVVVFHYP